MTSQYFIPSLLKPCTKLRVEAFNVRTFCQIGEQASLARTIESRTASPKRAYKIQVWSFI